MLRRTQLFWGSGEGVAPQGVGEGVGRPAKKGRVTLRLPSPRREPRSALGARPPPAGVAAHLLRWEAMPSGI